MSIGAAARRLRRVPLVRRLGWGVGDQMLSSATNFALGVLVARAVDPATFGAFALAFAAYTVALNVGTGLVCEPFAVRCGTADEPAARDALRAATGTALAVGCAGGVLMLAVAAATRGATGSAAWLAFGLTLPGLVVQNTWRSCFFARRRADDAFFNDLVWAVALVALLAVAFAVDGSSLLLLCLAWGVSATVAAVFGCLQGGVVPELRAPRRWVRDHGDLGSRYVAEGMTLSGGTQLSFYGIGLVAGLPAVGAVRAAQMLLGPLYVVTFGIRAVALPELVRVRARAHDRLPRQVLRLAVALTSVAALLGTAVSLLPSSVGEHLLGATWELADPLLLPVALWMAASACSTAPRLGLRALADASRSLRARVLSSVLVLSFAVGGAAVGGALAAAWGWALALWLAAGWWWLQFRRAWTASRRSAGPPSAEADARGTGLVPAHGSTA